MKKNLFYFIFLTALGFVAYYFEEFKVVQKTDRQRLETQLVDTIKFQDILALKTTKASLVFANDTFVTEKDKAEVDKEKVQQFFHKLTSLRVVRVLEKSEIEKLGLEHFFGDSSPRLDLQFTNDSLELILGKKLEFDRTFYMKVIRNRKEQYIIARDIAPRQGFYFKENEHRTSFSYLNLKEMMNKDNSFFTVF